MSYPVLFLQKAGCSKLEMEGRQIHRELVSGPCQLDDGIQKLENGVGLAMVALKRYPRIVESYGVEDIGNDVHNIVEVPQLLGEICPSN